MCKDQNTISVGTASFKSFLSLCEENTMEIPEYQRPYVWSQEKVDALLGDIKDFYYDDHMVKREANSNYYMGALLLHQKEDNRLQIIDGQQRITTLLLLDHALNAEESVLSQANGNLKLNFNSPLSKKNILSNYAFVQNDKSFLKKEDYKNLLDHLVFTIIISTSEDEAFTFFETQNNRGVKLSPVDYLKSYHLRELKSDEDKQKVFAKQWDKDNQNQFLNLLFTKFVWRARKWRGKSLFYENQDLILNEFQKETHSMNGSVQLYPNRINSLAKSLSYSVENGMAVHTSPISIQANPENYPFSIRQPIEKGLAFFLFTQKYAAVYKYIFKQEHPHDKELNDALHFYREVYYRLSIYLKELFKLCLVMYYDKFGSHQINDFALWLDYLLGSYRIHQKSIVAQTPIKMLRDDMPENLLDVIDRAYLPQEVYVFLKSVTDSTKYTELNFKSENGVQAQYKNQLLAYFKPDDKDKDLSNKINWINDFITNRK